jgi:hypothetical protein
VGGVYGLDRVSIDSTWQLDPAVDKASGGSVARTVTYQAVAGYNGDMSMYERSVEKAG